jgi:membrane associated rhomboid family serine protease/DNA-directed RNA polymerase subunit RPC12/RpoP
MVMIFPYQVDVPMRRWPIANWGILGLMLVGFIIEVVAIVSWQVEITPQNTPFILNGWSLWGLVGHMWLHAGIIHLAGNMLFLWVFGNAVCAKVGNALYPLIYVALGVTAGVAHVVSGGGPAIGASGAINGIVGMYLVLYPVNDISCAYVVVIRFGRFAVSGFWMILLWLAFDIWGAVSGSGRIAYFAHLGGFAAGFGLAFLLIRIGWIQMDPTERSLLQILGIREVAPRPSPAEPTAPAPAEAEEPIPLRCSCGRRLKAPSHLRGKTVKCPDCSQPILVREPSRRHGLGGKNEP